MNGHLGGAMSTRYRVVPAEQPSLFPTVQGMVYLPRKDEVWSSESANSITIRSTLSPSFPVKRKVDIDCDGADDGSCVVAMCCVPPFGMMWCALSCGRLVLVDLATYVPKLLHVAGTVQQRRATPVHSMIFCSWHTSGSIVSTSVYGVIAVWDAKNLVPLSFIAAADANTSRLAATSKCMACWEDERFVFVGMRNMLIVADGALESCTRKIPLGDGDALSMSFSSAERTLWIGKSDGSIVKAVFSEDSPGHLSPQRRTNISAVQKLASSLEVDSESLLDRVVVHAFAGVHRSYVHKVACAVQHVVSCGGDGSTCVLDPASGYVLQRVSLDDGLCVRELVVVGTDTVLFSLTDRSLRSMTLRSSAPPASRTHGVEYASPQRNASLQVTPRRAGPIARAGSPAVATRPPAAATPALDSGPVSTRQLIQHCVWVLQALQNLQADEQQMRQHIEHEQSISRGNIDDVMEYRLLTKYISRGSNLDALEKLEMENRLFLHGALWELRLDLVLQYDRTVHASASDEIVAHLLKKWGTAIDSLEASARLHMEHAEAECRAKLRWAHLAVRVNLEDLGLCHWESQAADKVIQQLEETVKNSVPATTVAALRASLEAAASSAERGRDSAAQRAAELESNLYSASATVASLEEQLRHIAIQRQHDSFAVFASVEAEQRAELERHAAESWCALVSSSHVSAMNLCSAYAHRLQDSNRGKSAMEDELSSLQLALQNAQRELRSSRSTLDATSIIKKKLEADVADLKAQLEVGDERVKKYENELSALDLEVVRLRAHKSKLEERLEGATSLAEESCSTAAQQQQLLRHARQGLVSAKENTVKLFTLFETSATTQFNSSLTDARGLLRDALYDIADARRCQASSIRNSAQSVFGDINSGGDSSRGEAAANLQGAFEKLKKMQDECFAQLQEHSVIVDRQECFGALRALLKSLEVVNSM